MKYQRVRYHQRDVIARLQAKRAEPRREPARESVQHTVRHRFPSRRVDRGDSVGRVATDDKRIHRTNTAVDGCLDTSTIFPRTSLFVARIPCLMTMCNRKTVY